MKKYVRSCEVCQRLSGGGVRIENMVESPTGLLVNVPVNDSNSLCVVDDAVNVVRESELNCSGASNYRPSVIKDEVADGHKKVQCVR